MPILHRSGLRKLPFDSACWSSKAVMWPLPSLSTLQKAKRTSLWMAAILMVSSLIRITSVWYRWQMTMNSVIVHWIWLKYLVLGVHMHKFIQFKSYHKPLLHCRSSMNKKKILSLKRIGNKPKGWFSQDVNFNETNVNSVIIRIYYDDLTIVNWHWNIFKRAYCTLRNETIAKPLRNETIAKRDFKRSSTLMISRGLSFRAVSFRGLSFRSRSFRELETWDPLKNDWDFQRSFTWMIIIVSCLLIHEPLSFFLS